MKKNTKIVITLIAALSSWTLSAEIFHAHCRDYPPELSFVDNTCVGAVPDLITDIMDELGHEIVWKKVPWIRSMKEAKSGHVDLLIRHSMTPGREEYLNAMPYAYYIRELSFYKSPKMTSPIASYQDISRHQLGAIRGNFYSPDFLTLDTKRMTLLDTTEQLVGMLALSRIDLAVTSSSHREELFKGHFEKVTFVDTSENPQYISIAKASKASKYFEEINKLLLEYRKSNKVDQYFKKYGLPIPNQIFE